MTWTYWSLVNFTQKVLCKWNLCVVLEHAWEMICSRDGAMVDSMYFNACMLVCVAGARDHAVHVLRHRRGRLHVPFKHVLDTDACYQYLLSLVAIMAAPLAV